MLLLLPQHGYDYHDYYYYYYYCYYYYHYYYDDDDNDDDGHYYCCHCTHYCSFFVDSCLFCF